MTPYAVLANLYVYGMPAVAMGAVLVSTQQSILDGRNDYADDKMRARYALPLRTPYPVSLIQNICMLAAYDCMMVRGFNPAAGADVAIKERAEMALKWFDDVERQRAHPNVVEAAGGAGPGIPSPSIISKPLQGWYPGSSST